MLISDAYCELNRELFERDPHYGVSGAKWAPAVDPVARSFNVTTLLDYGAGRGLLKQALPDVPYDIIEYDPAVPGKEAKPVRADMVYCGDVLEHIEPECLYAVLDDIRNIARTTVMLVIATRPAEKVLADGRNAHLIVEPSHWWLRKIMDRWRIHSFRDFGPGLACVGLSI